MVIFTIIGIVVVVLIIVHYFKNSDSGGSSSSSSSGTSYSPRTYSGSSSSPSTPARQQSSSHGFTMSQINSMSASDRKDVAEAIGCDVYNLSSIDNLAISTILIEKTIKLSATDSYLCKSPLCSCDTTIFTLFVVRALSIYACPTEEKAHWFDDYYVPLVIKGLKYRYTNTIPQLDDMINSRTGFYDRVFMKKPSLDDKLNAVFEEFEYVIKTDIIHKQYTPFSESSPLPILGMPDDHACQVQISNFCHNILRFLAPYYKDTMDDMNV